MGQHKCCSLLAQFRKINLERCALADFTVHKDIAFALLHDSIHGRESETRSVPNRLGGKEGVEDLRFDIFIHAAPRVAHHQDNAAIQAGAKAASAHNRLRSPGASLESSRLMVTSLT